jgi:hypothetical protein
MKLSAIFLFSLTAFVANAEETIPDHVELEGKFKFNMKDSSGQLHFDSYIKSPSELVSASACTLQVTADDDYYNTYPIEINLFTVDGEVVPFIQDNVLPGNFSGDSLFMYSTFLGFLGFLLIFVLEKFAPKKA